MLGVWQKQQQQDEYGLNKEAIIDWIYNLQARDGFKGGTFLGIPFDHQNNNIQEDQYEYDVGHIAMTYTALCTLSTLGDDLSRICKKKRKGIVKGLQILQRPNGRLRKQETRRSIQISHNFSYFLVCLL